MRPLTFILGILLIWSCGDQSAPQATKPALEKTTTEKQSPPTFESISERNLFQQIETTAIALKAKMDQATDYQLAQKLVNDSKHYGNTYKDSEKTPGILFRAGEVARSIGGTEEAIGIFRHIYTQYPQDDFAIKALFMEANTFEDDLKEKEKAKRAYQQVIAQYPKHELAEQARQLLEVIDKSPEELIKEFQKKQGQ